MPIENERKYVLDDPHGTLERFLGGAPGVEAFDVLQAYLDRDCRLRIFRPVASPSGTPFQFRRGPAATGPLWPGDIPVLSFKRKVAGQQIEIECPVEPADAAVLLTTAGVVVSKRRFKFRDGEVCWDVDFMKSSGETYFVLAEAEMPVCMDAPSRIPGFVQAHMLFDAGRTGGFGNRKLADVDQVRKAVRQLRRQAVQRGGAPSCNPDDYRDGWGTVFRMAA